MKIQRGFTLIETMVVITVLALITAFAFPSFQNMLVRNKVRNTVDLISQTIYMGKSEALRRNIKTYVEVIGEDICIGTTSGGCELRREPLVNGVTVSATKLVLSPFYGAPSPAPATFTVTYSGVTQSVNINKLGMLSIGAMI